MGIIINKGNSVYRPVVFKAAVRSGELGQRILNDGKVNGKEVGKGNGSHGIINIVNTGNAEGEKASRRDTALLRIAFAETEAGKAFFIVGNLFRMVVKFRTAAIGHDPAVHDVTYENCQARERTQILMDMSNRLGGIVLGTGDLSELALGWATYNGDHMSMYGVNAGVPKTLVKHLVDYYAHLDSTSSTVKELLLDIIDTPISPELVPAAADGEILQRTEDLVGPYELHDFFLYYMLRYGFTPERIYYLAIHAFKSEEYDEATIRKWLDTFMKRFFQQQFKRSCLPDGPKVGSVCLSPRGDWRMPSDASSNLWRK